MDHRQVEARHPQASEWIQNAWGEEHGADGPLRLAGRFVIGAALDEHLAAPRKKVGLGVGGGGLGAGPATGYASVDC